MPELRKDPIVGRWVIISTERGKRPSDFGRTVTPPRGGFCPFCPGNESRTPPEVYAERLNGTKPDGPGWRVRVVSNKFPALEIEGDLNRRGEGIYDKMSGVGAHEVVIETTHHEREMSQLAIPQLDRVFTACRQRMTDLAQDRRFRYIQVFKNHGEAAGASLEHSHTQLVATPIIPRRVAEELKGCAQHFEIKERCIFCDIVDQELAYEKRVVCANDDYLVIEPFAPRFPFETWLLPRRHERDFEDAFRDGYGSLARIYKELLLRMNAALSDPPYNWVLHTAPYEAEKKGTVHYHWHIELMPRLTKVAGFEWGTGFYINPTPPEDATRYLREAVLPAGWAEGEDEVPADSGPTTSG
ncbi:MAG: galactose-1-phosphate uridylyltransferase [Candidatus Eisenbacteria bacterium]|nr:galactose-1-phosphate uridylyltransferase [Candidatus Latescibacterota bacterium]MBD3301104.1 galactose-1-phosphate uridylyltransferase [Candidatus Eisenbacteria bacterium]